MQPRCACFVGYTIHVIGMCVIYAYFRLRKDEYSGRMDCPLSYILIELLSMQQYIPLAVTKDKGS